MLKHLIKIQPKHGRELWLETDDYDAANFVFLAMPNKDARITVYHFNTKREDKGVTVTRNY